jgi:hypothetical protein
MKTRKQVRAPSPFAPFKEKPMRLRGALKDFEEGMLCWVVARRHQGRGPVKLLLHVAVAEGRDSFAFGSFGCYVVEPGTLMGLSTSREKAAAAAFNGRKGGRPKKEIDVSPENIEAMADKMVEVGYVMTLDPAALKASAMRQLKAIGVAP